MDRKIAESINTDVSAMNPRILGDEGILVGNGTCNILSLSEDATQPRTVQVESTVGNHTYRLEADIAEVEPQVYVTSIERVETF